MSEILYSVTKEADGKTLRDIIRSKLKISATLLSKLKKSDGILLNRVSVSVSQRVRTGDLVTIILPKENSDTIEPVFIPLNILYEDEYLLIVNKPKDMPTHPSAGNHDNTLGNACMYYYKGSDFVFRPVNRLDRDTTGIVVIAKDARTSAIMSTQMQNRQFIKTYYTITEGIPCPSCGIIDAPIAREKEGIIKRIVSDGGKRAITEYKTLKVNNNLALLEIILHTGRTHQIRVHMSHTGTPLLYDYLYGKEVSSKTFFLHCGKISFFHPVTNKPMIIETAPDFPEL